MQRPELVLGFFASARSASVGGGGRGRLAPAPDKIHPYSQKPPCERTKIVRMALPFITHYAAGARHEESTPHHDCSTPAIATLQNRGLPPSISCRFANSSQAKFRHVLSVPGEGFSHLAADAGVVAELTARHATGRIASATTRGGPVPSSRLGQQQSSPDQTRCGCQRAATGHY